MGYPLTGIFLDTGQIDTTSRYHALGIIRGVTTNPTILVKDGVAGGRQIAKLKAPKGRCQ